MDLSFLSTDFGRLLTVTRIKPNSKAEAAGLKTGDVVISINNEIFRDSTDLERAILLLKQAPGELVLEIQEISMYQPILPVNELVSEKEARIIEPLSVGVVRTRTFDSNDDFFRETESLKISGKVAGTTEEGKVNESAITVEASNVNGNGVFSSYDSIDHNQGTKSRVLRMDNSDTSPLHIRPRKSKNKPRKLWITVTKEHQRQQVGISFAAVNQRLLVTKVKRSGMLHGTPLVPGDTILSINKVDFRSDPNPEEAFRVVTASPVEVTLEILKTGYIADDHTSGIGIKSCLQGPFLCTRRKKEQYSLNQAGLDNQKDECDTASLSVSVVNASNTIEV
jgi:membrane-associated protease RseP (regulator of RpoE activity)